MAWWSEQTPGSYDVGPQDVVLEGINPGQDSLTQFVRSSGNALANSGSEAIKRGVGDTKSGMDLTSMAGNYFRDLLGTPAQARAAIAPAVDQIDKNFGEARKTFAEGPRGGGRASSLYQMPFQAAEAEGNLLQTARSNAATGAAQVGQSQAQTGNQEQAVGTQGLFSSLSGALNRRAQNLSQDAANTQMLTGLGAGVGKILSLFTGGGL